MTDSRTASTYVAVPNRLTNFNRERDAAITRHVEAELAKAGEHLAHLDIGSGYPVADSDYTNWWVEYTTGPAAQGSWE